MRYRIFDLPPRHRAEAMKQLSGAGTGNIKADTLSLGHAAAQEAVGGSASLPARTRQSRAGDPTHIPTAGPKPAAHVASPLLNKTEQRFRDLLLARGYHPILEQAITLRLDPPFKSYRPDLAYIKGTYLVLVEVKAPHRFSRAGIAKAALAAKTYPMFRFELFMWTKAGWKEFLLTP